MTDEHISFVRIKKELCQTKFTVVDKDGSYGSASNKRMSGTGECRTKNKTKTCTVRKKW